MVETRLDRAFCYEKRVDNLAVGPALHYQLQDVALQVREGFQQVGETGGLRIGGAPTFGSGKDEPCVLPTPGIILLPHGPREDPKKRLPLVEYRTHISLSHSDIQNRPHMPNDHRITTLGIVRICQQDTNDKCPTPSTGPFCLSQQASEKKTSLFRSRRRHQRAPQHCSDSPFDDDGSIPSDAMYVSIHALTAGRSPWCNASQTSIAFSLGPSKTRTARREVAHTLS
jgi:hypothetical protein